MKLSKKHVMNFNALVVADKINEIHDQDVQQYFEDFRAIVNQFVVKFKKERSKQKRKNMISELCDLQGLYSIQIKLGYKLPKDLADIAYDFDNPDYPGLEYISENVYNGKYVS